MAQTAYVLPAVALIDDGFVAVERVAANRAEDGPTIAAVFAAGISASGAVVHLGWS